MTDQQPDLDTIEALANAATPGPWFVHQDWPGRVFAESEFNAHVARVTGSNPEPNEQFIAAARTAVPELVAEVRRLRAERDRFADRVDTLTAVAKGNKRHVQEMFLELQKAQAEVAQWRATFGADALPDALARLERAETERDEALAALTAIRHLHKDSPMGPCPVCIDADAIAAGGDGLVPYPCPTGRLAGAQDCEPPERHTCHDQKTAAGPDWKCPHCSTLPTALNAAAPAARSAAV